MDHSYSRAVARLGAAAATGLPALAWATTAAAHGNVTGTQDIVQDYGVLIFLGVVVLVGAALVAWLSLSPEPGEEEADEEEEASEALAGGITRAPIAEAGPSASEGKPGAQPVAPTRR
jgi:hypothetical protein